ncbi:MAG: flagellar filament capping protein FliD [Desulfuromonadales bacterium]|nr:flagellar filament capping protein FliD [Desulfuromonadales bacterium]
MSITFGGLATGIDTDAIVSTLMKIERAPIDRLQKDQAYFKNRLNAFSKLEEKLKAFLAKAEATDSATKLNSPSINSSSDDYLTVTARNTAAVGSYQMRVMALAQQQKDVSQGYVSKTAAEFGTGTISLTVAGEVLSIAIDSASNSLEGIAKAINDANPGVGATIINDGTDNPYRLVLTGNDVAQTFSLDASGLSGGSEPAPVMNTTQIAQQAHVQIDGIDVYANSNTVDGSIPGLVMELLRADPDMATTINISTDKEATGAKIKEFVSAYNDIITFLAEQKDSGWGNDSAFRSIKGQLQSFLVSRRGEGAFSSLSQLGFETQRDGKILLNDATFNRVMEDNFAGVVALLAGSGETSGVSAQFAAYLKGITDRTDGIYAGRKKTTDSSIRQIDQRITGLEARMEQKERTLRTQFAAMEQLVSGLNAQGGYLLQQLANMPTIGSTQK